MRIVENVIIGAGPHSLSVVLRLACHHPWDECTFDVVGNKRNFVSVDSKQEKCNPFDLNNLLVIDESGSWLSQWKDNFSTLEIQNLRSSVLVHVDAFDPLSLLEFIEFQNPKGDLPNVFDTLKRSQSKGKKKKRQKVRINNTNNVFNEAQRKFFTIPTSKIFLDHAEWLIAKHSLQNIVEKGTVTSLHFLENEEHPMQITLASGEQILAKNVIYAGNQTKNRTPRWADAHIKSSSLPIFHTSDTHKLRSTLESEGKRILVIGGGLSAAHTAIAAAKRGHAVTIVSRSKLKVKQFDIPAVWMSSIRNMEFSKFYALSTSERYDHIQSVRDGGSITPELYAKLQKEVSAQNILLFEKVEVQNANYMNESWEVELTEKRIELGKFDVLILATGKEFSLLNNPLLGALSSEFPPKMHKGYPILEPTLKWNKKVPLYIMGALASLEIGPDALNLMGGQVAASRIVPEITNYTCASRHDEDNETHHALTSIHVCNRFSSLLECE